jgi:dihydrofolate synthase/folylpolyglutamate synthase
MEGFLVNYAEALKYLEGVSWLGIKPGLERIEELLARLGNPERRCRYVHVAGTNGKGSTSAMLAAMLTAAGHRTGLYTSPHLLRVTERMRIDGAEMPPEGLAEAVTALAVAAEGMSEKCTEFELMTAAAFWWFAHSGCEYVVLEVGMGGRLDATNVIPCPDCAVIANIGLDHTGVLGDTVEQIAGEKAGIFKGGLAASYQQQPSVAAVLRAAAERTGTELHFADFSKLELLSDSLEGQSFRYDGHEYRIRLLGEHQTKNAAVAITAARLLGLPESAISEGLAKAVWPARFELLSREPYFVVDGGHNPQCVATTAAALRRYFPDKRRVLLMGVLADKDWQQMLDILLPCAAEVVCVTPESERAMPAEELCAAIKERGVPARAASDIASGVDEARALAGRDGMVCSVGSLYMSGAVRAKVLGEEARA